jgi:hypothetical protein
MVKRVPRAKKPTVRRQKALKKKALAERRRQLVKRVVAAVSSLSRVPRRRGGSGRITIREIVARMGSPAVSAETVRIIRQEAGLGKVKKASPHIPDIPAIDPPSSQRRGGQFRH